MYAQKTVEREGFLSIYSLTFGDLPHSVPRPRWEYMERGDSVCLLVQIKGTKELIVAKQFRVGPFVREGKLESYSNPAGMVDDDETPIEAAIRECREEVGVDPISVHYLGHGYPSSGGTTERSFYFFIEVEDAKEFEPQDKEEGITLTRCSIKDYWKNIESGVFSSMQMQTVFLMAERMDLI